MKKNQESDLFEILISINQKEKDLQSQKEDFINKLIALKKLVLKPDELSLDEFSRFDTLLKTHIANITFVDSFDQGIGTIFEWRKVSLDHSFYELPITFDLFDRKAMRIGDVINMDTNKSIETLFVSHDGERISIYDILYPIRFPLEHIVGISLSFEICKVAVENCLVFKTTIFLTNNDTSS
ncbi:MAG TPA: hypothetical protein PK048_01040 [Candidatus Absconditabacterales bacterium]|nr:hypothetical protein [Candidatus Absconditabacterales bacterium]